MQVNNTTNRFFQLSNFDPEQDELVELIDSELAKDYSLNVVIRAQELKNHHSKPNLTQDEYLNQTPNYVYTIGKYNSATPSISGYDDWSKYTRSEILKMDQEGKTIPDAILEWARTDKDEFDWSLKTRQEILQAARRGEEVPPAVLDWANQSIDKAKEPYNDLFYLQYAQQEAAMHIIDKINYDIKQRKIKMNIIDGVWAQFSYQEILEMEDNGVLIPDDVLKWAHGKLAQDYTEESVNVEIAKNENSGNEEIPSQVNSNALTTYVKKNIVQVDEIKEKIEKKRTEFNSIEERAINLKNEKQDTYQDEIKDIDLKISRIRILVQKKENNTITPEETVEYKKLLSQVNNDSEEISEINNDKNILDIYNSKLVELSELLLASDKLISKLDLANNSLAKMKIQITPEFSINPLLTKDLDMPEQSLNVLSSDKIKDTETIVEELRNKFSQNEFMDLSMFAAEYADALDDIFRKIQNLNNEEDLETEENEDNLNTDSTNSNGMEQTSEPDLESENNIQSSNNENGQFVDVPDVLNPALLNPLNMSEYTQASTQDLGEKRKNVESFAKNQEAQSKSFEKKQSDTHNSVLKAQGEHGKNLLRIQSLLTTLNRKNETKEAATPLAEQDYSVQKDIISGSNDVQSPSGKIKISYNPVQSAQRKVSTNSAESNEIINDINLLSSNNQEILSSKESSIMSNEKVVNQNQANNDELDNLNKMISSQQKYSRSVSNAASNKGIAAISRGIMDLFLNRDAGVSQISNGELEFESGILGLEESGKAGKDVDDNENIQVFAQNVIDDFNDYKNISETLSNKDISEDSDFEIKSESPEQNTDAVPQPKEQVVNVDNVLNPDEIIMAQGVSGNIKSSDIDNTKEVNERQISRFNEQQQEQARKRTRKVNEISKTQNGNV